MTIFGSNLTGSESTFVVYDDLYEVEATGSSTQIQAGVPIDVTAFLGSHTLVVQSRDIGGTIRTHGPVSFTVDTPGGGSGPPILSLPEFIVAEADSTDGAVVEYTATAKSASTGDPVDVTCNHPSGSRFPLGTTIVTCSATDAGGTSNGGFSVFVTDTAPPVVTVPDNIESENPVVTFTATAVDNLDGPVSVSCSPASGSTFSTGTTTVRCTAYDSHFNQGSATFTVRVTSGPPVLIVPENMFVEATSAAGAVVTWEIFTEEATSSGCTPASGSTFAIGTRTVTCTATNTFGTTTRLFTITVEDNTGPVLTLPDVREVEATSPAGATATFSFTAVDAVDGNRTVDCTPASGTFFSFGDTEVFCTSTDTRGNLSTGTFIVRVQDTTAPTITVATASVTHLWPPNHQMVPVTISVQATDAIDPNPTLALVSVESNQPINGTGDGDDAPDWTITGPFSVNLRAERSQGVERVYTITVSATDLYGNVSTATILVRVADPNKSLATGRIRN